MTSIGHDAFRGCSGLTSVTIGTGLTDIDVSGAFFDCYNLEKVVWNAENCFIHSYTDTAMFGNCSKLTQVIIGENVKTIPAYTFEGCSGLTSVTIGNSVTSISEGAFSGCIGLTSVTIPNSVTSIGEWAFAYCSGLKNITYTGTIADWKNIAKGTDWNDNVSTDCIIHCTDGDIKLSK